MDKWFIKVNSITTALRAKELLIYNGYRVSMKRAENALSEQGCGYMLISSGDIEKAEKLLKNSGIKLTGRGKV